MKRTRGKWSDKSSSSSSSWRGLEALEGRRLMAASPAGTYPFAPGQNATVTDADGTAATFAVNAGSGQVVVGGDGAWQVSLTGTTAKTVASVSAAGGDGRVRVTQVTSLSPLATFEGSVVDLAGGMEISATTLRLGNVTGPATVKLSAPTKTGSSATFGAVTDASVVSMGTLKVLSAAAWRDTDGQADSVAAPAVGALAVAGDFAANLTLSLATGTTLASAKVGGAARGTWTVAGSAGTVNVGQVRGTIDVAGSVKTFTVGEHVALMPLAGAAGGTVHVGGKGRFSASGDAFAVENSTVYPTAADVSYAYAELYRIDWVGEAANYSVNGKRDTQTVGAQGAGVYAVASSLAGGATVYSVAGDGVRVTRIAGAEYSVEAPGGLAIAPGRFARGARFTSSAPVNAVFSGAGGGTLGGTMDYATTFVGHELVKTPAGSFLAAKFASTSTVTATGTLGSGAASSRVSMTAVANATEWATPTRGVVRSDTTGTTSLTLTDLGKTTVKKVVLKRLRLS